MTEIDPEEYRDRVFRAAEAFVENYTVPLVQKHKDGNLIHSSGVLIQIADMRFLVTTSHYVIENRKEERHLQIVLPKKGEPTVPIVTELFWTTIDAKEDLLVTKLDAHTVAAIGEQYRYVFVRDFISRETALSRPHCFLILGFPFAMVHPDDEGQMCVESWKYLTCLFDGDYERHVENFDPKLHLILKYEQGTWNNEGKKVHPPGMSGCGIWMLHPDSAQSPITADMIRLVAIQTAWRKTSEYSKGTWINVVLTIIWKHYSDARAPLRVNGFTWP